MIAYAGASHNPDGGVWRLTCSKPGQGSTPADRTWAGTAHAYSTSKPRSGAT